MLVLQSNGTQKILHIAKGLALSRSFQNLVIIGEFEIKRQSGDVKGNNFKILPHITNVSFLLSLLSHANVYLILILMLLLNCRIYKIAYEKQPNP